MTWGGDRDNELMVLQFRVHNLNSSIVAVRRSRGSETIACTLLEHRKLQ